LRLKVAAGPHEVGVAVVRRSHARGVDDLFSELATTAGVNSLGINGPLNPTGPGDTASRRRIFTCTPRLATDEVPCARRILASLLSFFLWSSLPDSELLALAAKGRLSNPTVLAQQTSRMLADPRAAALVDNLAGQWLQLRQLDDVAPVTKEFDGNLRFAFKRETELLFETIVHEDRAITDLLDADYTFVDERL